MSKWKEPMWKLSTGQGVFDWCKENNIHHTCVYVRVYKGKSVDEACRQALQWKGKHDLHAKYLYKGTTLKKYINNESIYSRICYKIRKGRDLEEVVKEWEEQCKN